jgi:hypothetical protein
MEYDVAMQLAGQLYGNILHRNADGPGYEYYLKRLTSGAQTLRDLVEEFFTCEEFIEKFVVNQTPNELGRNILQAMIGPDNVTLKEAKQIALNIIKQGYPAAVNLLMEDERCLKLHGALGIPRYAERKSMEEDDGGARSRISRVTSGRE